MSILTREQSQALLTKVLSYSKADECEVNLSGSDGANIRYARNAVSTSGALNQTSLVVSSAFGKKLGVATINEFDDASLKKVVQRAEELARLRSPDRASHERAAWARSGPLTPRQTARRYPLPDHPRSPTSPAVDASAMGPAPGRP